MSSWFVIDASIKPADVNADWFNWRALSRNNNVQQHMLGLQNMGFRVADIKIYPYEVSAAPLAEPEETFEDILGEGEEYGITQIITDGTTDPDAGSGT
jgi:hypothetical protein